MAEVGMFIGALIPTYLISRLFVWLLKRMAPSNLKIALAHAASLGVCWVLSALGTADGGSPIWNAGVTYVLPQFIWFSVDLWRGKDNQQIGSPE